MDGSYTVILVATNANGSDTETKVNFITVGGVSGEGFILSKNSDFSTDDRACSTSDTIYIKLWTDMVDHTKIKQAEWELKDPNNKRVKQTLTNHGDGTYTASFSLSQLPSNSITWAFKGKVEDTNRKKFQVTTSIMVQ